MAEVARLMTFVDADDEVPDARLISVSARHEAVLDDGRRVVLMDDRGWSESGPSNIWVETSVQDIVDTRAVADPMSLSVGVRARTWRQTIGRSWLGSSGGRDCCGYPGPEATIARRRAQRAVVCADRP